MITTVNFNCELLSVKLTARTVSKFSLNFWKLSERGCFSKKPTVRKVIRIQGGPVGEETG